MSDVEALAAECSAAAAPQVRLKACSACFGDEDAAGGVACAENHFLCKECIASAVRDFIADPAAAATAGGRLCCPVCERGAAYDDAELARRLPAADAGYDTAACVALRGRTHFDAYLAVRTDAALAAQADTLGVEWQQRLDAAVCRAQDENGEAVEGNGWVPAWVFERHVAAVSENVLTLKCPRCRAAFVDFNRCLALTCHRCKCGFCAYCLTDCGKDAHVHVMTCPESVAPGNFYLPTEQWEAFQRERRGRLVAQYADNAAASFRRCLLSAAAGPCRAAGVTIPGDAAGE